MARTIRILLLVVLAAGLAGRAGAQDKCAAKGSMGGKAFTMKHCAVAVYDEKGVTIWFSEAPIPAQEVQTFHTSSYPQSKDPDGKGRTMMYFAFCPGGAKATPSPAAVKSVEMEIRHASSPMLWQTWLFEPGDKALKIEKLSGDLKPGGKLSGRITGKKTLDDGTAYSWEADFDLQLPATAAAAGPGCGGSE